MTASDAERPEGRMRGHVLFGRVVGSHGVGSFPSSGVQHFRLIDVLGIAVSRFPFTEVFVSVHMVLFWWFTAFD